MRVCVLCVFVVPCGEVEECFVSCAQEDHRSYFIPDTFQLLSAIGCIKLPVRYRVPPTAKLLNVRCMLSTSDDALGGS